MQYHITHDFNITLLNLHPTMSLITSLDQSLANLIPLIQPMPDCLTEYADILDLPLYSTKYLYKYHTWIDFIPVSSKYFHLTCCCY